LDEIKTEAGASNLTPTATTTTSTSGDKENKEKADTKNDVKVNSLDIPTKIETVKSSRRKLRLDISMKAIDILEACQAYAAAMGSSIKISSGVLPEESAPPRPPDRPKVKLSREQLLPPTPSVYLENKKDAFSPQLQEFCLQHPITVVRGIANALKLDLGLFSTKMLQEEFATHPVEVWTQNKQSADENWDPVLMKQVWNCPTSVSHCTIGKYALYQAASFQEGLRDDTDKPCSSAAFREMVANETDPMRRKKKFPILKFGANVDLSNSSKWRGQLSELIKLPGWTRTVNAGNMLSHLGHHIVGMNTVRLYMKVPCARVPAHQENNNLCLININIGPGDCEWFGVPHEYWGALKQLCDKHKINYLSGSWWPNMHELMEEEIPVYRFLQRPGDLVWVNSGCVYWVQAAGWCNNIAWNVGPLTHKQYSLALERYEWNKLQGHKSGVGMLLLSWSLARNVRLSDQKLYTAIKNTLLQSLKQIILTIEVVKSKGLEIKQHKRRQSDPAHFCSQCERELYSILFIREEGKKPTIYCLACAIRKRPQLQGFGVCLEEFRLKELLSVYDNFKLHPPPSLPSGGGGAVPQVSPSSASHHHSSGGSASALTPEFMAAAAAMGHYPLLSQRMDII
jgi:histone demethylase